MREKSSGCDAHAGHVRGTTDMCSRDPPVLHPALAKANGKNSSPQPIHHAEARADSNASPTAGGRLKFFKDGKFILELSHRRDGERTTWFSVPKKTFWPPTSTIPSRQESSTSLSGKQITISFITNIQLFIYLFNNNNNNIDLKTVSDDNSSIQSSPWQRDHCWKQSNPKRNVSTEFNFYYRRNPKQRLCVNPRLISRKRRQPLDSSYTAEAACSVQLTKQPSKSNGAAAGKTLSLIIDKLSRLDPTVVSPRKRILRELERVSLEDQASKRRATPQPPMNTTPTTSAPSPSSKQLSSYSITSILGEDKPSTESGFLRTLLKPEDKQTMKYSSSNSQPYPRTRVDPYIAAANTSIHHPLYGVPMLPPGPYRAPLWMHYSHPIHYPAPLPLYAPPPPHPSSSPIHYKDYREQTLTPPSGIRFVIL